MRRFQPRFMNTCGRVDPTTPKTLAEWCNIELEADYRKKVGAGFKQRTFNEALISHGTIGIGHLRTYLMAQP